MMRGPPGLSGMTPRRMLVAMGVLIVGINVLSAVWDIRNERVLVERNALRDYNNLTALLADQTARSLDAAGILVSAAANDVTAGGVGDAQARARRFRDRISGIPQVRSMLLLDRDGRLVLSTDDQGPVGS